MMGGGGRDGAAKQAGRRSAGLAERLLAVQVQWDAFRVDPRTYVAAIYWRILGKKLRSRNMIEPLAGRSPHAYLLWRMRCEPSLFQSRSAAGPEVTIHVVIDMSAGQGGLADTLSSLPPAGPSCRIAIIGGNAECTTGALPYHPNIGVFAQSLGRTARALILPIRAGDQLAPDALASYRAAASHTSATVIYADEDLYDASLGRYAPHLKPDWNPDLFQFHDFLSHAALLCCSGTDMEDAAKGGAGWVSALTARLAADAAVAPMHVPVILHHRRSRPEPHPPIGAVPSPPAKPPRVTAIVPTRNKLSLLRACMDGLARTAYPALDVIVIDHDSDEPDTIAYLHELAGRGITVLPYSGPFNFSVMNNIAARQARGDMLCFLNNDIEMLDGHWLTWLVRQAMRDDVGAVGARLLYPDRTIQHAGVALGVGGGAGHAHRFLPVDAPGYFARHKLPQMVSAVTAACMVVRADRFSAVGGFDEKLFRVAFNDVDLCLKLNQMGWQSFYEPRATLIHHESKSRGKDSAPENRERFAGELAALKRKWHTDDMVDPYHHPSLSRLSEQYVLGL